ncbi:MAG: rod shape-determining protein MreC [Bacteroidales bacterium]|nr:rod shape-determining protein MreC [Bacteroidales bacterium]
MARGNEVTKIFISAAIFIVMEVAAISLLATSSTLHNIWLNRFSHRVMAFNWGLSEDVRGVFLLNRRNEELAMENHYLNEELRRYREMDRYMEEKSHMATSKGSFQYIPATIIKMSRNSLHNYIILNKGYEDGVQPHSGIISEKGVVGVVQAVGRRYSYGITLMNSNMNVSSRIGRTGLVATLTWNGVSTGSGILRNIPPHMEVNAGDTVLTSGFSFIFPPDIPIGVTGEMSNDDGVSSSVNVDFFQDFSALRFVTVVVNPFREEITQLEKGLEQEE